MNSKNIVVALLVFVMIGWTMFEMFLSDESSDITSLNEDFTTGEQEVDEDQIEEVGVTVGDIAPDFELMTLNGEVSKLSDYRGQKIMLNFWATWCPPCRAEMPDMQKVFEDNEVMILAVNLTQTETSVEQVEQFAEDFGLTFPILLDEHIEVADLFGIQPVPTSFMIDTNGRIESIAIGPMNEGMMIQKFDEMD